MPDGVRAIKRSISLRDPAQGVTLPGRVTFGKRGTFQIRGVPAGEELRIRCWRPDRGDAAVVDVGPFEARSLLTDLRLELSAGVIVHGTVLTSGRHPAVGARCRLLDPEGRDLWGVVTTDAAGRYEGPPVPVMPFYRLEVRSPVITPWSRPIEPDGAGRYAVDVYGSVIREAFVSVEGEGVGALTPPSHLGQARPEVMAARQASQIACEISSGPCLGMKCPTGIHVPEGVRTVSHQAQRWTSESPPSGTS